MLNFLTIIITIVLIVEKQSFCLRVNELNYKKYGSICTLVFIMVTLLFPSVSFAHAYIKVSSPLENEQLEKPPDKITIQFNETILKTHHSLKVYDSSGKRVDKNDWHVDSEDATIFECSVKDHLPNGVYRIRWKVISADGHPVEGVIPFQIGTGKSTLSLTAESKGYTPKADLIMIRWLQYISNAAFVGLFFILLLVLPKQLADSALFKKKFLKLAGISLAVLSLSLILSLPLQATIGFGISWSDAFSMETLWDVWTNTLYGRIWIIQMAILLTMALTTHLSSIAETTKGIMTWTSYLLGIGLLLTKAFTSHATAQPNTFVPVMLDFLHLFAASVWIGSLISLIAFMPGGKEKETRHYYMQMIKSFSKWGLALVLLLAGTGIFAGFQYIPDISSLFRTSYGKVLVWKVALFIIMLVFAAINFYKGKKAEEKGLVRTLWGEVSTGLVILVLTIILTNLPTAMAEPGPFSLTKSIAGNRITLHVTPNRIGRNVFEVRLIDSSGKPLQDVEQVTLTFSIPNQDTGKNTVNLTNEGEGEYRTEGLYFNMSGKWNVHVHVLTKSLESIDTNFRFVVGSE